MTPWALSPTRNEITFISLNINSYRPKLGTRIYGTAWCKDYGRSGRGFSTRRKGYRWSPLGPSLGPLGINVKAVVDEINKKTATFNGMQVPVKIEVDAKKNFTVTVGIPPTTALIKKEANIEKGSAEPNVKVVGNLPFEAAVRIANMKLEGMLAYELKTAVKEVIGTCVSMGVNVDGKRPKEVLAGIDEGKYDSVLVK